MDKRKRIFPLVMVLLLLVVGYRLYMIFPCPYGGGQYKPSPDGKLEAHASDIYDQYFWGGEESYYEFYVSPKGAANSRKSSVFYMKIDEKGVVPEFDMRGDGDIITWAEDSSSVRFTFKGIDLNIPVK